MNHIKIKTERLLLRPLIAADADEVFEWVSDERVSRYMVYTTYTNVEQVREWLAFVEKDASTYLFGFERLSDGKKWEIEYRGYFIPHTADAILK